jgi:hypothetical protein
MDIDLTDGEASPPKRYAGLKPAWTKETRPTGGRPLGARNKLSERFLEDLQQDWAKHGRGVIERAREKDPVGYLKVIAQLVPREDKMVVLAREVSALTVNDARHLLALIDEAESSEAKTIGLPAEPLPGTGNITPHAE